MRTVRQLGEDLRYAARGLRRTPGFTIAAVLSLALGIGANTAIFSLIDAAMLRPLPVREPDRLIELLTDRGGVPFNAFSDPAFLHFRTNARTVDALIASHSWRFQAGIGDSSDQRAGQYVSGDFFPVLGVTPFIGRLLQPSDDSASAGLVAVLSHRYWQQHAGADRGVVGRQMTVDDRSFTIVGVAAPAFRGIRAGAEVDFWIPLAAEPQLRQPSWRARAGTKWLQLVASVKPDVSVEEARAELQTLFRSGVIETELSLVGDARPDHPARQWRLVVDSARAGLSAVRQQFGGPLLVLLGVSAMVLLIACVNVANLLLARGGSRRMEIAVRASLGASQSRIIRQLLAESALLASAGAALGVGLAYAGCRAVLSIFASGRSPVTLDVAPDLRVLAFASILAILTSLLFGLAPAWRTATDAPGAALVGGGRVRGPRHGRVLRRLLIGGQVALSVTAMFGAGLFLRSLHNLQSIDTGFDSDSVLLVSTDPSRSRLPQPAQRAAYRDALTRIGALPGVQVASLADVTPIEGGGTTLALEVRGADGSSRPPRDMHLAWVGPQYFAAMKIPMRSGRDFTWQDAVGMPRVAIVNDTFARQHFGDRSALGASIGGDGAPYEIVGVVGDAKYLDLRQQVPPTVYLHAFQRDRMSGQLAIRSGVNPEHLAAAVRQEMRAAAPSVVVTGVRTLARQIDASIARERLLAALSACFAVLGLLLAAVGLHGVMAYSVSQRRNEIGIRMALGAPRSRVTRLVAGEALVMTAVGAAAGAAAAVWLSRGLGSLLYGLGPRDPLTLSAAVVVMLLTALVAAYVPSRRAASVDPATTLRE